MAPSHTGKSDAKKRRGRPPGSRNSGTATNRVAKPVTPANSSKTNKSKKKLRGEDEEDELSVAASARVQPSQPRKGNGDVSEPGPEPTKRQQRYMRLEYRTKKIPQDVIETWPHLPQQALEQISDVIKDAKKDIANTQRDERKVMAAHNTLNPLVKKLVRQLSASKIPPQARDIHFNVDKLTERNGHVSRDVTRARHSSQLLSEQVQVAQSALSKDERNLDEMKKNAKRWRAEWRHQQKLGRIHPLLKDVDSVHTDSDDPDNINLKSSAAIDTSALDVPDAELAPLLEQLRRSLENMQGNHAQVEGIDAAMTDVQMALDEVLYRYSSAQQYLAL